MDEHIMTQTMPVSQARQKFGELINQVYKRQVRIIVEKSGIPVAALVALPDLERWLRQEQQHEALLPPPPAATEVKPVPTEKITIPPPSKAEVARRQALVANILTKAQKRVISPLTTADLLQQVRVEREEAYERWSR
ncbi:MAG: type II toxin-antitoxin system Phd/YefM family antitoxin [Chloroflexi bacterium]|nr:type II toxin-antitoxin system Phd/YefM family antitoxin [Chloroflexota bacterium]